MNTTIVIATYNRSFSLLHTLEKLFSLPEAPPVLVVDNGSQDRTAAQVRASFPQAGLIALGHNRGIGARNVGVEAAGTPYVAFCDDDSWWAPGALPRAEAAFEAHQRLALIAGRVLVGPHNTLDPTSQAMAASPLAQAPDLPGQAVLGFVACGAVVRRQAFLEAGGFEERFTVCGEESLLALDLAASGWGLAYLDDVVAHHHPGQNSDRGPDRQVIIRRNDLWAAWLRRPLAAAWRHTARMLGGIWREPLTQQAAGQALAGLGWVMAARRVIPPELENQVRLLEAERPG